MITWSQCMLIFATVSTKRGIQKSGTDSSLSEVGAGINMDNFQLLLIECEGIGFVEYSVQTMKSVAVGLRVTFGEYNF